MEAGEANCNPKQRASTATRDEEESFLPGGGAPGGHGGGRSWSDDRVLLCNDGVIYGRHLPPTLQTPTTADREVTGGLKKQVAMLERDLIIDALKRHRGNINAASRDLGITSRMVRYKIENLDIDYDKFFKKKRRSKGGKEEK